MIERLAEDHSNARRLAEALSEMDGIVSPGHIAQPEPGPLDPTRVRTNFVLFKVERDREAFLEELAKRDVWMIAYPYGQVRAVPHYGVTAADIETVIRAVEASLAATPHRPAGAGDSSAEPAAPVDGDTAATSPSPTRARVVTAH